MVVEDDACGFHRNDPACADDKIDSFTQGVFSGFLGRDVFNDAARGQKDARGPGGSSSSSASHLCLPWQRGGGGKPCFLLSCLALAGARGFVQQSSHSSSTAVALVHSNA